jgi:hypothetical protein
MYQQPDSVCNHYVRSSEAVQTQTCSTKQRRLYNCSYTNISNNTLTKNVLSILCMRGESSVSSRLAK